MTKVLNQLRAVNLIYLILSLTSLILQLISPIYRSFLGNVKTEFEFIATIFPEVALSLIFTIILSGIQKIKRRAVISGMILSVIFSLLSVGMIVPWLGMFIAVLTPFHVVYFFALLSGTFGYGISVGVSVVFMILNIYAFSLGWRLLAYTKDPSRS